MRRDLADPELFGNEAGEDEDAEILNSYFLKKPEFDRFYNSARKIAFVRSRKGMGKSALLKHTLYQRRKSFPDDLLIYVKASDLYALQETKASSPTDMIYGWQQRLCTRINLELGARLRFGFSDESMMLIESAEVAGFRSRNIISALIDRFKIKGLPLEPERTRLGIADSQNLLNRVSAKEDVNVWLLVDDVDATFINTEHERLRVSTFFSACRNLVSNVEGLCIRASVRSDVWTLLAQHDEALDKCEQYMLNLSWSTEETGRILEGKIHSYFARYYPEDGKYEALNRNNDLDRSQIRRLVFKEPFPWSRRFLEAFRPIHILSAGRPRWATQLCKLAGKDAFSKSAERIAVGHIDAVLREYGQYRLADLYKEHRHQCNRLEDIVESFSGGQKKFTTKELLDLITEKIIRHRGLPNIDGIIAANGSLTIAHLLFRMGFIMARDEGDQSGLGFISFEDRPNLLSSSSNLDDGLAWEIHPSYREVLRIKPGSDGDHISTKQQSNGLQKKNNESKSIDGVPVSQGRAYKSNDPYKVRRSQRASGRGRNSSE
ncbi:P-loop ATPase, Sll1717 family [Delftia sp. PS-11]|uniref:P-loop ATPase, Sll1717 family n=1 Tax=Delftia sp. PS-11 TaxID=2767222 RepID=UPI002457DFD1|nr:hypothetical protein [Delftia sp. PS-11]KAJ8738096.1 hypothetical protein H9T68_24540 [Delftia sp. PS-11]